jgi:hypothetical protein
MTTASTNMLQLPVATGIDGSESLWIVQGGTDKRTLVADVATAAQGIPTDAQFLLLTPNGFLTASRTLTGAPGIVLLTDNGAGSTVVVSLVGSGVAQLVSAPRTVTAAGDVIVDEDDLAIYMRQTVAAAVDIELPFASDKNGPVFVSDVNGVAASFNFRIVGAGAETINGQAEWLIDANYGSVNLRPVPGVGYVT